MIECRNCGSDNMFVENTESNTDPYQSFGAYTGYEVECFTCGLIVSFEVGEVDDAVTNLYAEEGDAGTVTEPGRELDFAGQPY